MGVIMDASASAKIIIFPRLNARAARLAADLDLSDVAWIPDALEGMDPQHRPYFWALMVAVQRRVGQ